MVLFWTLHLSLAPCVGIVKADYWQYVIVSALRAPLLYIHLEQNVLK